MATGRVKWFSDVKGYGFIEAEGSTEDVFVHYSEIAMDGYKTLKQNTTVAFDLQSGAKGLIAQRVRLVCDGQQASVADVSAALVSLQAGSQDLSFETC